MAPASLVQSTHSPVLLTGTWLQSVVAVYVDHWWVPFTVTSGDSGAQSVGSNAWPYLTPDDSPQAAGTTVLTFTAPPSNDTGYLPFTLTYNNSLTLVAGQQSSLQNWTGDDWLYYTPIECDTGLIQGYTCEPCPAGGYCPGGGRVWPLPGYWSWNEQSAPIACALPTACPGALVDPVINPSGTRNTSQCAAGYTGSYCASCSDTFYLDGQRCLSCGLESTQKAELTILLLLAVGLFFTMAVGVATLSPTWLASAVSAVVLVQHFSLVGKLAGQEIPDSATWLAEAFTVISMCNFDVTFVKPGCSTPQLSFLDVYWLTLAMVALSSALFTAASGTRALLAMRRHRRQMQELSTPRSPPPSEPQPDAPTCSTPKVMEPQSPLASPHGGVVEEPSAWWLFRARLMHSHLILGSILYLRLTTLELQALNCTSVTQQDGSSLEVLKVDLSTVCNEGAHFRALFMVWPLFLLYVLGFPVLCCFLLYRQFHAVAKARAGFESQQSFEHFRALAIRRFRGLTGRPSLPGGRPPAVEMSKCSDSTFARGLLSSPAMSSAASMAGSPVASPRALRLEPRFWGPSQAEVLEAQSPGITPRVIVPVLALSGRSRTSTPKLEGRKVTVTRAVDGDGEDTAASGTVSPPIPGKTMRSEGAQAEEQPGAAVEGAHIDTVPRVPLRILQAPSPASVPSIAKLSPPQLSMPSVLADGSSSGPPTSREARVKLPGVKLSRSALRAALAELAKDAKRQELLGYMYRQLRGELYYFRLLFFLTSFGFACCAVLPGDPVLRLLLTGLMFLLDLFAICAVLPFEVWWKNATSALTSMIGVVECIALLALVQLGLGQVTRGDVNLGHSTAAHQQSDNPADELTGYTNEAQRFELYLGMLLLADALLIAAVHRRWLMTVTQQRLIPGCYALAVATRRLCERVAERVLHRTVVLPMQPRLEGQISGAEGAVREAAVEPASPGSRSRSQSRYEATTAT